MPIQSLPSVLSVAKEVRGSQLLYVAYPMRLDLSAANAIQTYNTVRELRSLLSVENERRLPSTDYQVPTTDYQAQSEDGEPLSTRYSVLGTGEGARPNVRLVVPRWLWEKSAFSDLDALHLPRPAVNKLSRILPWAGWSYIERTLFAWLLVILLLLWRVRRIGYRLSVIGYRLSVIGYRVPTTDYRLPTTEVLYVRDAVCAAWLGLLRPLHGAKVIYEVHDLESSHPSNASRWPRPLWKRLLPMLDRAALGRAHRLVSLTHAFRRWAVQHKIRSESTIAVIPDAYDPALYHPRDKAEARAELGVPQDAFVVGYGGLTFAYRRLDLLIEAFARFSRERRDALLLLVGGRPHEVEEMRALARQLRVESRVITPGQVSPERNALYMSAADTLAIPDTVTGMTASPLKLFEYMALGKPIVLKDTPALREIVDNESALFFPAGDAEALAHALSTLYNDPDLARKLANAALSRSEGYTYKARAERILEVVRDCL